MTWLIPRDELTNEQGRAAELKPDEHRLILGSPGSGKTMVLLHRARYLADEYRVPPERYWVFHGKLDTDSTGNWTPIPREAGRMK